MDLSQSKLSKNEWQSIEVHVQDEEKKVIQLIMDGYGNTGIRRNDNQSILNHLKIDYSPEMEYYLYKTQFEPAIQAMLDGGGAAVAPASKSKKSQSFSPNNKYAAAIREWMAGLKASKIKQPSNRDMIRIQNTVGVIQTNKHVIFEFVLLDFVKELVSPSENGHSAGYVAYSLIQLKKASIQKQNKYVNELVDAVLAEYDPQNADNIRGVFYGAHEIIERNKYLIQYEDQMLYEHQEKLFSLFGKGGSGADPKLVMYMAPTGTGKTLSPLGLSQGYAIIFVCVARHVGLALAKSAISVGKRIAFAFGCETASDIRLHYFAAVDYKVNKRSGGIGKVDNSNGSKVEIMICDVASYLTAMHYMLAFNPEERIITYWDEPTITMDYETHYLHETISKNWRENKISKLVLSCATLPKHTEIAPVVDDFVARFTKEDEEGEEVVAQLHIIDSYDTKKTISLLNKDGKVVLPHFLFAKYADLLKCVRHVENNRALLRYFDVEEIAKFVKYVCNTEYVGGDRRVEAKFRHIGDINLRTLKNFYLDLLANIDSAHWDAIYAYFTAGAQSKLCLIRSDAGAGALRKTQSYEGAAQPPRVGGELRRLNSTSYTEPPQKLHTNGVLVSTADAYTLTDGPSIFLCEDVGKIGLFYIQQAKIPDNILTAVLTKIEKNNEIQKAVDVIQKEIENKTASQGDGEKTKKAEKDPALNREVAKLMDRCDALKSQIEHVAIHPKYIPNTETHQDLWIPAGYERPRNAFVPNVDQDDVKEIMSLGVDNQKKLMLILGIGVFDMGVNTEYIETMKRLAQSKKLFLIIASSDYIYGTNYQFSHGFIGKDLENMTQQKTIQAIGRIGRNNIQQDYTLRFRDNDILTRLFLPMEENREAKVMCALFCG